MTKDAVLIKFPALAYRPLPGKGMFVPFPQSCIAHTLVLQSCLRLRPKCICKNNQVCSLYSWVLLNLLFCCAGWAMGLLDSAPAILAAQRQWPPCRATWPDTEDRIPQRRLAPVPAPPLPLPHPVPSSHCPRTAQDWWCLLTTNQLVWPSLRTSSKAFGALNHSHSKYVYDNGSQLLASAPI